MKTHPTRVLSTLGIFLFVIAAGCHRKAPVAVAPPPAPPVARAPEAPKPAAPTIAEFVVEPDQVQRGQMAQLRWRVSDATQIEISQGIGAVASTGRREIGPADSTTYTLIAKGPGGEASANANLTVVIPPPPPPPAPPPVTITERLRAVQDGYFDFDKSNIREDARSALTTDSKVLKSILTDFPAATIMIEGHCDERGSAEYNIALGDRRATSAKEFLIQSGVPGERLNQISYGKDRPQCTESNETCWQLNRRVHFSATPDTSVSTRSER